MPFITARDELAKCNAQFVERIVDLAKTLGREIATPDEARENYRVKSEKCYPRLKKKNVTGYDLTNRKK